MRAGELDRRITIRRNTPTRSGTGAAVDNWADLATVWAKRRDARGSEIFEAAQDVGVAATVYTIRYRDDVRDAMQIVDGAETWDIKSVGLLGGRKDALEIFATRQGA